MDFKALRFQIFSGSIARRVLLRALMIASALSIAPLLQIFSGSEPGLFNSVASPQCHVPSMFLGSNMLNKSFLTPIWASFECKGDVNLTINVVRELMDIKMLDSSAKALCVGEGAASAVYALRELGFANALGVHRHPFFSLKHRKFVHELQYADNSFDFVFSRDLDKISAPAILVLEIERILKPGGIGAILVGGGLSPNSLIKSATPISSLLKSSTVVHVDYVDEFIVVVFKKKIEFFGYFQQFSLPADCQSVVNYGSFMEYLEPPVENKEMGFEKKIAYLPKFIDVASRRRLVYVDIGVGEHLKTDVANWFLPSYPVDQKAFNVYFVDHNTSVLLSCVKKPGVTFIYYPGLAGDTAALNRNDDELNPYVDDEGFDFLAWFKETVQYADFVVLKMRMGDVELKFLADLFRSGTICLIDELFLDCSDHVDGEGTAKQDCLDLLKSLRNSGVFVHQWWGGQKAN